MADFPYTVEGRWPFPPEMLEVDRSEPATPEDAEKIRLLTQDCVPDLATLREVFSINLVMKNAGRFRPRTAKWESFDWKVPGDQMHALMKAGRAQESVRSAALTSGLAKLSDEEIEAFQFHGFRPSGGGPGM